MWYRLTIAIWAVLGVCGIATAARADCGQTHVVAADETLFSIADLYYGDMTKWSVIFYNNPSLQGGSLLNLAVGSELSVPCVAGATAPDATPLLQPDAEMMLLTGSNYAPFTDRAWPGQGMACSKSRRPRSMRT